MKSISITCKAAETREIDSFDTFQGNLKELSKVDFEKLKKSIIQHGFSFPVFVWKNFIINGHQRITVLKSLLKNGYVLVDENGKQTTKVPVALISAKNRKEAAQKLLLENSGFASITEKGLYDFMSDFKFKIEDMDAFKLPEIDFDCFKDNYFTPENQEEIENEVPEVPEKPKTKKGDLYELGEHRLLCGDATNEKDVKRLMNGKKADMVFTDPPYGVGYEGGAKKRERLKGDEAGTTIYSDFLPLLNNVTKNHAALYLWYADAHVAAAAAAAAGYVITAQIIWAKNNAQFVSTAHYHGKHEPCFYAHKKNKANQWFGGKNEVTLWEYNRANKNEYHPTQKPIELATRAITNSSIKNNIILDLFLGSGSTLIACEKTNRICYGLEIDCSYIDVIVKRWIQYMITTKQENKIKLKRNGKALNYKIFM